MTSSAITRREIEILHLVSFEHSSKKIIDKLYIAQSTDITNRQNLMNKLNVKISAGFINKGFKSMLPPLILALFSLCMTNTLTSQSCSEEFIDSLNNNVSGLVSIIDSQRVVIGHDDKAYIYTHDGINWNISDSLSTTSGNISDLDSDTDRVVLSNHHSEEIHIFDWNGTVWNETIITDTQNETFWLGLNIALHKDLSLIHI